MIRVLALASLAVAGITCAESTTGLRGVRIAGLALAPSFAQAPAGGPDIEIARVRGVLRNGADSSVAEAEVEGDSAILEFTGVPVTGDSTAYGLTVQAFDPANVLVFQAEDTLQVGPGTNEPAAPVLEYVAPDAQAATIDVSETSVQLDWAGAVAGNTTCLNRAPRADAVIQKQLSVTGLTTGGQSVGAVRVGWTSRDTTVATVSDGGLVVARCSNKSTWIVARSFLDKSDSVLVTVTAPAFSLLMSPDSTNVARGATVQLGAVLVDENGNVAPASTVNWASSNTSLATVSASGVVTGINNGRVLITARSGDRTTVGVVQVVRPAAASVLAIPGADSIAVGSVQTYYAKAIDANNRVMGDVTQSAFTWTSTNGAVAEVAQTSRGVLVKGKTVGTVGIIATLDGKADTIALDVKATLAGGGIKGRLVDAATDQPLSGVEIKPQTGASAFTDANGFFDVQGIQPGDSLFISKFNYVSVTLYDAPVFRGHTIEIPDAGLPVADALSGVVQGKVVNALNGGGVSGVTVKAYKGINAAPSARRPNPEVVGTATTTSSGHYTLTLGSGVYTLHFSATGYSENITLATAIGNATETLTDVLLPPRAAGAGLVAVLTWGPSAAGVPADLDAHVTGPDGTSRFHVYTGNRAFVSNGDSIAVLELDRANSAGPEVVTIRATAAPGSYRFYVHNYSGRTDGTSKALADSSGARVDVYQDNRVIGTFFPPAGVAGTLWKVFEFDGARLVPVNQIAPQEDATVLPMVSGSSDLGDVSRIFSATQLLRKGR